MTTQAITSVVATVVVILVGLTGPARAQSLAEVARVEAERRARVAVPGKVYTNGDLVPDFTRPPVPDQSGDASADATRDADPAPTATPAEADAAVAQSATVGASPAERQAGVTPTDLQAPQPADGRDETYWRNEAQLIRTRLANQIAQIEQLRTQERSLAAGAESPEKALVRQTLQKAIADLTYLNDEWRRFETSARERKVPEHWLR